MTNYAYNLITKDVKYFVRNTKNVHYQYLMKSYKETFGDELVDKLILSMSPQIRDNPTATDPNIVI